MTLLNLAKIGLSYFNRAAQQTVLRLGQRRECLWEREWESLFRVKQESTDEFCCANTALREVTAAELPRTSSHAGAQRSKSTDLVKLREKVLFFLFFRGDFKLRNPHYANPRIMFYVTRRLAQDGSPNNIFIWSQSSHSAPLQCKLFYKPPGDFIKQSPGRRRPTAEQLTRIRKLSIQRQARSASTLPTHGGCRVAL